MNNNSGKQMLLSVVGVAVLVIAVVGVSFAFFTYTRTGAQDNVIQTGTLTFAFEDTSFINIENQFPITTQQGLALTGAGNICEFSVKGSAPTGTNIGYTVFAEDGDAVGSKTRLKDSEVFVALDASGNGFTPAAGVATGTPFSSLTNDTLGTGTITGSGQEQTVNFTARMWVDSSVVSIGEGKTYTAEAYGNLYYSMRIRVEANA